MRKIFRVTKMVKIFKTQFIMSEKLIKCSFEKIIISLDILFFEKMKSGENFAEGIFFKISVIVQLFY